MDIQLIKLKLPFPQGIKISFMKNEKGSIVTWNQVTSDQVTDIKYNIYYSTSVNGIFYKLNKQPLDINWFEHKFRDRMPTTQRWYKVSTVYDDNGEWVEGALSNAVTYQATNTNRWFIKVNERNMWILKNTGTLFDLYTRKTEGDKCPKCYDSQGGRAGNSQCKTCFGTGIVGGYEPKLQLYIREKPAMNTLEFTNQGVMHNNTPGAWTISQTHIKPRDILINPQGIMYIVVNSHINHAGGFYFHQELQIKELDQYNPIYNINRVSLKPEY